MAKKSKVQSDLVEALQDIPPGRKIKDTELQTKNTEEAMWVAIAGKVFDLTDFYMEHPGGYDVIEEAAGKDATSQFEEGGHDAVSIRDLKKFYIGEYEPRKLSLQEMKEKEEKEQMERIKKEKQLDMGRNIMGFAVGAMLLTMIAYFVYGIYTSQQHLD